VKLQAFLPLVTYPDQNAPIIVDHAVALAKHIGAELHATAFNADIPPVSNALSRVLLNVREMVEEAETVSRLRGEQLLASARKRADAAGVPLTTDTVAGAPALLGNQAALQARYFDLSLIGCEAGNVTSGATAQTIIFGSGRPSVLLPELCEINGLDQIAIAWDGTSAAARAVSDARFLLERAKHISVLTVLDEKPLKDRVSERLTTGLRQRGLAAEAVVIRKERGEIGAVLQKHAVQSGAKLLVMGGYGHSRLRDFVLGGATASVLEDVRLPILLSH